MSQAEQALIFALRSSHTSGKYTQEELDEYIPRWIVDRSGVTLNINLAKIGNWFKWPNDIPRRPTLKVEATDKSVRIECHVNDWSPSGFCVKQNGIWSCYGWYGCSDKIYMPKPTIRRLVIDFCRILNTWLDDSSLEEAARNTFRATIATFESKVEILLAD